MSGTSYTVFNALTDIIAAPTRAFDEIREHNRWFWWPFLISLGLAAGLLYYYYSWVDIEWLKDYLLSASPAEQAEAAKQFMTTTTMSVGGVVSVLIMSLLIYLIQAIYFNLVNKVSSGSDIRFGQWFSFSVWSGFPAVFGTLAGLLAIFTTSDNQLPPESLQVLSLNQLITHHSMGDPWFGWASAVQLTQIWLVALMAIGFSRWTGTGFGKSLVIAAAPTVLIFGIWAATI